jgi:hypothetical protein
MNQTNPSPKPDRREFLAKSAAASSLIALTSAVGGSVANASAQVPNQLSRTYFDSLVHSNDWFSLNPGYWRAENGTLRRRLENYGDRCRKTGFPFHATTHGFEYKTEYDPTQPVGIIYQHAWKLTGAFKIKATFTLRGDRPKPNEGEDPSWAMFNPGTGIMGIALGAKSIFESHAQRHHANIFGWADDQEWIFEPAKRYSKQLSKKSISKTSGVSVGDQGTIEIEVKPIDKKVSEITVSLGGAGLPDSVPPRIMKLPRQAVEGFVGVAAGGMIDFEVNEFLVEPGENMPRNVQHNDCWTCYPLGDTLKFVDDQWQVRFVSMFASNGRNVELRISDQENPVDGWKNVPVAGSAEIVNNRWRRNTAALTATLPFSPAEKTLYFTVWKDGVNVTADQRIGTGSCGPGTGNVGDVPSSGKYVGRLPQLVAPYKVCGLSCHAINDGFQTRTEDGWKFDRKTPEWTVRDQPSVESYKHLDDYKFHVMLWEDDVWYMELLLYPPSTDDAYRVVQQSICGPTSRWQMMRHWNVINPGDHDYGMDDIKGPEQLILRNHEGLGQDPDYLRRNFQIVHHLTTGEDDADPIGNPKKWRSWKMPNQDFTLVVCDSRLWRSSQDVDIWDDAGWGKIQSLYDRTDPTRSLLGEEQFSWLEELLATDSSRLICLTGISGLHTVWTGAKYGKGPSLSHPKNFDQRDRVTADYAGWVKAGADRVLELLGSRDGVVTVYGDVHNGCIMKNQQHRVIECSFGPIGRNNGRALIPGFGPKMKDVDERDLEVFALYHDKFSDANQARHKKGDPFYWNFMEMEFGAAQPDPSIGFRIRNMVDPPTETPRGGGQLQTTASSTGREISCRLPEMKTLPNADVRWTDLKGRPIRATRSDNDGNINVAGLVDIQPRSQVLMVSFDGRQTESKVVKTI